MVFSQFPVRGIQPHARGSDETEHGGTLMAYDFEPAALAPRWCATSTISGSAPTAARWSTHRANKLRVIDVGADLPEDEEEPKVADRVQPPQRIPRFEPRSACWSNRAANGAKCTPKPGACSASSSGTKGCRASIGMRSTRVTRRCCRGLRTRVELSDLIWEMQGELGTSHAYEIGGDFRVPPQYRRGFLGADYVWDEAAGGYRITRIYRGDSWDRELDSPLAEPGLDVRTGDVIVALGGRERQPRGARRTHCSSISPRATISLTLVRDGERRRVLRAHAARRTDAALPGLGRGKPADRARAHRAAASATCTSRTWDRGGSPNSTAAFYPSSTWRA